MRLSHSHKPEDHHITVTASYDKFDGEYAISVHLGDSSIHLSEAEALWLGSSLVEAVAQRAFDEQDRHTMFYSDEVRRAVAELG